MRVTDTVLPEMVRVAVTPVGRDPIVAVAISSSNTRVCVRLLPSVNVPRLVGLVCVGAVVSDPVVVSVNVSVVAGLAGVVQLALTLTCTDLFPVCPVVTRDAQLAPLSRDISSVAGSRDPQLIVLAVSSEVQVGAPGGTTGGFGFSTTVSVVCVFPVTVLAMSARCSVATTRTSPVSQLI